MENANRPILQRDQLQLNLGVRFALALQHVAATEILQTSQTVDKESSAWSYFRKQFLCFVAVRTAGCA